MTDHPEVVRRVRELTESYGTEAVESALREVASASAVCRWCGKALGPGRPNRRFDSPSCRQKAYRAAHPDAQQAYRARRRASEPRRP